MSADWTESAMLPSILQDYVLMGSVAAEQSRRNAGRMVGVRGEKARMGKLCLPVLPIRSLC